MSTSAVADWEARNFFLGGWICVGHVSAFAERGQYVTVEIAGESLLFVGERGFYNVCRHRGARLLTESEGTTRRLQCPYHAWSYGFDGTLKNAPHTEELEDFDPACNGLREIRTETLGGLVFADPSGVAPPLADHVGASPRSSTATGPPRSSAPPASTTTSRPTGRRSSRTTPSACTAPACTPSSTASATT